MKRLAYIEIVSALLLLLFVYTGIIKLTDHINFTTQLDHLPVVGKYGAYLGFLIPAAELIIAALLLYTPLRLYGLWASFVLLIVFTAYLSLALATHRHLPCSCGGIISKLSWTGHVLFNSCFIVLTGIALLQQYRSGWPTGKLPSTNYI